MAGVAAWPKWRRLKAEIAKLLKAESLLKLRLSSAESEKQCRNNGVMALMAAKLMASGINSHNVWQLSAYESVMA
jgi:hypothetical protein